MTATKAPITPLDAVLTQLAKVVKDHKPDPRPTRYVSTSLPILDLALGVPGIPLGRIALLRGEPSTGKSTLLYLLMAQVQAAGGLVVHMETEIQDAMGRSWPQRFGLNPAQLFVRTPPDMETLMEAFDKILEKVEDFAAEYPVLFTWDSVGGTPTRRELEDVDTQMPAEHARLLSRWFRHITGPLARAHIGLVLVNQLKERVGVTTGFGEPSPSMVGDRPLRFASTLVLDVKRTAWLRKATGQDPHGARVQVTVTKNKVAPPMRRAELDLHFSTGCFDLNAASVAAAARLGVIAQDGGWCTYDGKKFRTAEWGEMAATTDIAEILRVAMQNDFDTNLNYSGPADLELTPDDGEEAGEIG